MHATDDGINIWVSDSHLWKQIFPIDTTDWGIIFLDNFKHLLNDLDSIFAIDDGIENSASE